MAIHLQVRSKMSGRGKADCSHGQAAHVKRNAGGFGFVKNRRGGVALTFALTSPVLFGLVGGGIDYARLVARRSQLQGAVDAGALAGGNALKLASSSAASVRGVTEQIIATNAPAPPSNPLTITVKVADDKTSVFARAEDKVSLTFGCFIGLGTQTVAAQARLPSSARCACACSPSIRERRVPSTCKRTRRSPRWDARSTRTRLAPVAWSAATIPWRRRTRSVRAADISVCARTSHLHRRRNARLSLTPW